MEPIRLEKVKKLWKRENSLFGSAGFWQKKDKVSFRSPHPQKRVWAVFWTPAYPSRWPWSTRWSWCWRGAQQTRKRGSTVQFRLCSMQFQSMSPSCSLFLLQGQPWIIFHIYGYDHFKWTWIYLNSPPVFQQKADEVCFVSKEDCRLKKASIAVDGCAAYLANVFFLQKIVF